MENNNYYCGIVLNEEFKTLKALNLFDNDHYYNGSKKIKDNKELLDKKSDLYKGTYHYFFSIDKKTFDILSDIEYPKIENKKISYLIEKYSLHEFII
jgi:hypothetical protein